MSLSNSEIKGTVCLVKVDKHVYRDVPPLGLLYVGDALKKAGFRAEVYHIEGHELEAYAQRIIEKAPLFVGFSVVTGQEIKPAAKLSRMIKKASDIPVVWGNVHPSHLPRQCLSESYVDMVCIGDGEVTSVELAQALASKQDIAGVAGIGHKREGRIIINDNRPLNRELDRFKADWDLVDPGRYIKPQFGLEKVFRITASRGCPHDCAFCYNQAFHQRIWRHHSAHYIIEFVSSMIQANGIEALYFNDDYFFVNQKWAWEILENLGMPYYVCLRADLVNDAFAQRLSDTNCKEAFIGFESGSDRVLRQIVTKGTSAQANYRAVAALSRYPGIQITGSFITALPGETEADQRETVSMICDFLKIHSNIRVILSFYRPMPGTKLYDTALEYGFVAPETTEGWSDFDGLAYTQDIPWLDPEARARAEYYCMAMETLAALYKFKVPILKQYALHSILSGQTDNSFLKIVNRVRTKYAFGDGGQTSTKLLRGLVNSIKKLKKLA